MKNSLQIINVIEVVKAVQRVPSGAKKTFFGMYDLWRYHAVFDVKLCDRCMRYAETYYYVGKWLRGLFPYLEITGEDTIKVNLHPHCRCELHRITDPAEYLLVSSSIFE